MVAETIDLKRIINGLTFKESLEISAKKIEDTDESRLDDYKREDTVSEN